MASGLEPGEIYVRVLAPSLHAIGASWRSGRVSIDQEHLASSVAATLIGRLGPRFVHPGRKKGVVIVAMPPGERHGLGVAMLADILDRGRIRGPQPGPRHADGVPRRCHARCGTSRGGRRECRRHRASSGSRTPPGRRASGTTVGSPPGRWQRGSGRTGGARSRCGRVGRGSARARRPDRSAKGTGVMQPLPAPVAGVPLDVETAAGRVAGYQLGEGRTVLLLHSFNAAGSGIELAPLASRLAEHRRVVLVDWLGFGTSDRPDAPYGWALYGEQLERIRLGRPAAGRDLCRCRRALAAGAVCRRRRRGASGAVRSDRPDQSDRIRPIQGQTPGGPPGTSTGSCAGRGSVGCCSRSSLGAR